MKVTIPIKTRIWLLVALTVLQVWNIHLAQGFGMFANAVSDHNRGSVEKKAILDALDHPKAFNDATKERTNLIKDLIKVNPTNSPGSTTSFAPLAPGLWSIVYAPHISTMNKLASGQFAPVLYDLRSDGTMVSHARYDFPVVGTGWLSVSGTYGSQDQDRVCRVDFDRAWIKPFINSDNNMNDDNDSPYLDFNAVPPSLAKDTIQTLGRFFFIDAVSVFPVSYLDEELIVFDFELLGTRICARKIRKDSSS